MQPNSKAATRFWRSAGEQRDSFESAAIYWGKGEEQLHTILHQLMGTASQSELPLPLSKSRLRARASDIDHRIQS